MRLLHLIIFICLYSCQSNTAEVKEGSIAYLSSSDGFYYDFSYTPLNSTKEVIITISNIGNNQISNIKSYDFPEGSAFSFKGGKYPGNGGSCNDSLQENSSCIFVIEFLPTSSGIWEEELSLSYLNGVSNVDKKFLFKGIAGQVPNLELSTQDNSFGILESFDKRTKTITLTNNGGLPLDNIKFSINKNGQIDYLEGSFPGTGGTCETSLKAKESCTIILSFEPVEDRTHSSTIQVNYFDYESDQNSTINVSGQSLDIVAKMFFNGILSADFGIAVEGSEQIRTINIRNEGFAKASNINFQFSHPDFHLKESRCPSEIAPTEQCEIDISYLPKAPNYGIQSSTLIINYYNSKSTAKSSSIDLTANARKIASLQTEDFETSGIEILKFNFGQKGQNSKTKKIITLVADSTVLTTATDLSFSSLSAPFKIESTTCLNYLSPGKKCYIEVVYNPTDLGNHREALNISYNNGSSVQNITFDLIGTSETRGLLRITELNEFTPHISLAPRPVGGVFEYTYTLKNEGVNTSTNIVPALLPSQIVYPGSFPGSSGTCPSITPFSLAPGASCTFSIRYSPIAPENILKDTLYFSFNDGTEPSVYEFTMAREARYPANIIVSEDSGENVITETNFGDSSTSNKYIKKVILYNQGGFAAQNLSYSFSNNDFALNGPEPTTGLKSESGTCPETGQNLDAGESCTLYITFTPSSLISYDETFDITYDNELLSTTFNHSVKGTGANIAYLEITPNDQVTGTYNFPVAAYPGGKSSQLFTVENKGQSNATSFIVSNIIDPFTLGSSTTCGSTITAGSTCQVEIEFTPTSIGLNNLVLKMSHYDGANNQAYFMSIKAKGVKPSDLQVTIPLVEPYVFTPVETNTDKIMNIVITNKGIYPAMVNTVSSINPFITINSETCTNGDINGFMSCTISLKFSPDDSIVGNVVNTTVNLDYNDGTGPQSLSFNVEGEASPPKSIHQGWKQILAIGNDVSTNGTNSNNRKVTLEWIPMIVSQPYPIDSYNIYRKHPEDEEFDYSTPHASGISPASNLYNDTNIEEGKRYIYEVRPIILGAMSEVSEEFSSIEVYIPTENMSFIHRRIANKTLCEEIGKTSNPLDNNSCIYNGPGSNDNGKLDIGTHLLYDRYEIGQSNSTKIGQLPRTTFTQTTLDAFCSTQTVLVDDVYKSKRVPSRLEYNLASIWPSTSNIDSIEDGIISSENCNSSSTTLETNNSNSSCVSKFGIYNLVGNAWEIVSERLISGIGVTDAVNKLYPENSDFDGLDLTNISSSYISTLTCLNLALGHPVEDNAGVCPEGSVLISSTTINNDYFWNPNSFGATFAQSIVGGNYDAASKPGRFTTAWVNSNFTAGGRCALEIEVGLKFPEEE